MRNGPEHVSDSASPELRDDSQNLRKGRILASAERLFSGNAYEAVSIRDIAAAAEVNSALVRYYFGSKEQLFRALFERRYHLITAQRLARIQALELKAGSLASLQALVLGWTEPLLALLDDAASQHFITLLAREASDAGNDRHEICKDYLDPSARTCIAAMKKIFPGNRPHEIVQAYMWMVACMMSTITNAKREARLTTGAGRKELQGGARQAARLQRFVVGGIWALLNPPG